MRFMHCSKTQKQNIHIDDFKFDIDVEISHDMIFHLCGRAKSSLKTKRATTCNSNSITKR
jgi:hypothetical protein